MSMEPCYVVHRTRIRQQWGALAPLKSGVLHSNNAALNAEGDRMGTVASTQFVHDIP